MHSHSTPIPPTVDLHLGLAQGPRANSVVDRLWGSNAVRGQPLLYFFSPFSFPSASSPSRALLCTFARKKHLVGLCSDFLLPVFYFCFFLQPPRPFTEYNRANWSRGKPSINVLAPRATEKRFLQCPCPVWAANEPKLTYWQPCSLEPGPLSRINLWV